MSQQGWDWNGPNPEPELALEEHLLKQLERIKKEREALDKKEADIQERLALIRSKGVPTPIDVAMTINTCFTGGYGSCDFCAGYLDGDAEFYWDGILDNGEVWAMCDQCAEQHAPHCIQIATFIHKDRGLWHGIEEQVWQMAGIACQGIRESNAQSLLNAIERMRKLKAFL